MRTFLKVILVVTLYSPFADADGTFTTEFQARVMGDDKVVAALSKLGVVPSSCPDVRYRMYDSEDKKFSKNNISIRYRDKGKKSDFSVKFKLDYNQETIKVLSTYFANENIKKEINRYYNFGAYSGESGQVELTFRHQVKKKDLGLDASDSLSTAQILEMFVTVVKQINDNYPDSDDGSELLASIRKKMALFQGIDTKDQGVVNSFHRCSWEINDWNGYGTVTAEYSNTQHDEPFLEVSTRVDGDVDDKDFFDKLDAAGVI